MWKFVADRVHEFMTTYLDQIAEGIFLYIWEGRVTLADIQASMHSDLEKARRVVFDMSRLDYYPFGLDKAGTLGHRKLSQLEHIYVIYKPYFKSWAETLIRGTLQVPFSLHESREAAMELALAEARE